MYATNFSFMLLMNSINAPMFRSKSVLCLSAQQPDWLIDGVINSSADFSNKFLPLSAVPTMCSADKHQSIRASSAAASRVMKL